MALQSSASPAVASGLASYDQADWRGGVPAVRHAYSALGMSTLLQAGGSLTAEWMEADVPPSSDAVSLFRIGTAMRLHNRIGGKAANPGFRPGDGCLLAPGTDSWWAVNGSQSSGWFHVHFAPDRLAQLHDEHGLGIETVPLISDARIARLVEMIFDLVSAGDPVNPLLWQSLGTLLLWRFGLIGNRPARLPLPRGGLAAWQVRRTTEFMADNLDRRVTLDELAAIARLSVFHFSRAFAHSVGMPPYRYQQQLRLEKACALLANTRMSVIEIALAVGYESPQALARVFARTHGLSPSQWRQRNAAG